MTRSRVGAALLLLSLSVPVACGDSRDVSTQVPAGGGTPGGESTAPQAPGAPTTPGAPASPVPDPYDPLIASPFIVDTGATPSGHLAFIVADDVRDHTLRIHSALPDGSRDTQLTPSEVTGAWTPAWSPDGGLVAYWAPDADGESAVWVVHADGSGNREIVPGSYPFWLADGRIGYSCGETDICAVDVGGTNNVFLLRHGRDTLSYSYTLSPDGTRFAFVRFVTHAGYVYTPGDVRYTVHVMRRDGSSERRLTPIDSSDAYETDPVWSPDGRRIAFYSRRLGIAVADADGGGLHSVSRQGEIQPAIGRGSPAWSPDGTKIIFGGERGVFFIANADGSGLIRRVRIPLTPGFNARSVAWSSR